MEQFVRYGLRVYCLYTSMQIHEAVWADLQAGAAAVTVSLQALSLDIRHRSSLKIYTLTVNVIETSYQFIEAIFAQIDQCSKTFFIESTVELLSFYCDIPFITVHFNHIKLLHFRLKHISINLSL